MHNKALRWTVTALSWNFTRLSFEKRRELIRYSENHNLEAT